MLYAYEGRHEIEFSLEYNLGRGPFPVISGEEGNLRAYYTSLENIKKTPDKDTIRTAHKLYASCDKDAPILRNWIRKIEIKDATYAVAFTYDKTIGKFPAKIRSDERNLDPLVMDHPVANKGAPKSFSTLMSLELLQEAIAPECIDGTIQILFGMDALIYMGTKVNGCAVTMAIAPRIET
jgi:hypothetical protein